MNTRILEEYGHKYDDGRRGKFYVYRLDRGFPPNGYPYVSRYDDSVVGQVTRVADGRIKLIVHEGVAVPTALRFYTDHFRSSVLNDTRWV